MIHQLSIDSLQHLDNGKAAEALLLHLKRAALDCEDRPGDSKARKVILQFSMVPVLDSDLQCTEVRVQIQAKSSVPEHRTKTYSMGLRRGGIVAFNDDSLDHIDQSTFLPDSDSE